MTPYLDDGDVRLYQGDALEQLALMPSESVQCVITSPPFWGLRSYIDDDHADKPLEIGLEGTPDEWCARLVAVMREARRVLRSDGVCWIEVGDTYAGSGRGAWGSDEAREANLGRAKEVYVPTRAESPTAGVVPAGLKPKDLCGAPWLLAFALRADGWYLRSDTIWSRPNPMPESVTDRPTKSHSYVFLLTKSARYFYDADAIREDAMPASEARYAYGFGGPKNEALAEANKNGIGVRTRPIGERIPNPAGRNARSVWSIATEPTPFAHFATFPQALVERCIKAGTSEHGCCSECGAPWQRVTESTGPDKPNEHDRHIAPGQTVHGGLRKAQVGSTWGRIDHGWEPSCSCLPDWTRFGNHDLVALSGLPHPPVKPCVVLDPFMGSGTTALVARRLGRHATGIELNLSYLEIAAKRLEQLSLLA